MEGNAKNYLICKFCRQQFDTKDAYDNHNLELCQMFFQQEVDLNSKDEDNSLLPTGYLILKWHL